jgi:hypothetical protein
MDRVVVLLEDDPRRAELMLHAVTALGLPLVQFDNAPDMPIWLRESLPNAVLIALDHDLGPSRLRDGERFEPGIGRDVADYLAGCSPTCPILIHSSNSPAAQGMLFCLEGAGWNVTRVYPFDDLAWIERDWEPELRRLIGDPPRKTV